MAERTREDSEFVRLMLEHRRRLFGYVYSRVPNPADAEDLVQESFLTACEHFSDFERGTNFFAWVRQIAHWKIKNHQRRFSRAGLLLADEKLLELLDQSSAEIQPELDAQFAALEHCLTRLKERDRRMIEARYADEGGVDEAARASGRSLFATYKALSRTRETLLGCVQRRLGTIAP